MKAMIFAAGYGKRLLPFTNHTPKPLALVKNQPVIAWILAQLSHYEFNDIVINTHHLAKKIEDYLNGAQFDGSISISFEKTLLGTGGGLYKTIDFWDDEDFYLCNSDILCTLDLKEFLSYHQNRHSLATLAINSVESPSMLLVDEQDHLVGLKKNRENCLYTSPKGEIRTKGFCGLQMISPLLFSYLRPPIAFSIIDEYLKLISKGHKIVTWDIGDNYWIDVGTSERLETANLQFPGFHYASS